MSFASTPKPPYYVVTFASQRSDSNPEEYNAIGEKLDSLAREQPGFLGVESTRDSSGFGITLSYWKDRQSIINWKQNADHLVAQQLGKERFYENFTTRIAKVEREYSLK
ncbi:hypothetical protein CLIB1423_16S02014 [[Candida] railenensis]|uniref:ABM domain-containing protein n=1 Tax=[Candida] railenensis TaxID=45579 RepID=A0A9P0VZX9_9ASCO|nr:hypothetical protein CLIB1423_16S02014 [[Candida] railenensis]